MQSAVQKVISKPTLTPNKNQKSFSIVLTIGKNVKQYYCYQESGKEKPIIEKLLVGGDCL